MSARCARGCISFAQAWGTHPISVRPVLLQRELPATLSDTCSCCPATALTRIAYSKLRAPSTTHHRLGMPAVNRVLQTAARRALSNSAPKVLPRPRSSLPASLPPSLTRHAAHLSACPLLRHLTAHCAPTRTLRMAARMDKQESLRASSNHFVPSANQEWSYAGGMRGSRAVLPLRGTSVMCPH